MNKKQAMKVLNEMLEQGGELPFEYFFAVNLNRILLCRLSNELDHVVADWKKPIKDWSEGEKENLAMVLFGIKSEKPDEDKSWKNRK